MLSSRDVARFRELGYLVVGAVASREELEAMAVDLDGWIEESRAHEHNWGQTPDGKARFDLEAGHSLAQPRLRRVANPTDISEAYRDFLWYGRIADIVAALIGPDVKFHHCKLNIKLPGMKTRVDWHQDHPFDPHTNDDMVTTLTLLDDMTEENGCLRVVPGSQSERHSHYRNGVFVGKVAEDLAGDFARRSVPIEGKAGDVCFMHTWTVHGSAPNRSTQPRRMLICDYTAVDAFWLTPPTVPSVHSGRVIRGKPTRVARLKATTLELPPRYEDDSFFGLQGQGTADGS
jgi:phytanoyl-CoA hydroxylase